MFFTKLLESYQKRPKSAKCRHSMGIKEAGFTSRALIVTLGEIGT